MDLTPTVVPALLPGQRQADEPTPVGSRQGLDGALEHGGVVVVEPGVIPPRRRRGCVVPAHSTGHGTARDRWAASDPVVVELGILPARLVTPYSTSGAGQ